METFTTQFSFQDIELEIIGTGTKINSILFSDPSSNKLITVNGEITGILRNCIVQLEEYFSGRRKEFTIPFPWKEQIFKKKSGMNS
jgi:hypothetical protein